ncbi:UNVERIFIED_CONTAM: hypothetical protein FKN15_051275, partial [Acipenser sinensis]
SGKICGDTFQKSFLEWTYSRYEVEKICQVQHFECPACTPVILAVSADGNRKHYRFRKATWTDEHGHFDRVFLSKDEDVSTFVDYVHKKTKHTIQKIRDETDSLENMKTELGYTDDALQQWVTDVQQWAACETAVGLYTKKRVFDKVMLLRRLHEEEVILSGKICGDTFQKSFLEWTYSRYEVEKICQVQHFECPACTPVILAVSADGNRKHYRFRKATWTDEHGHFDRVFLSKDEDVSTFVDYVHKKTKHTIQKIRDETDSLENMKTELGYTDDALQQWVTDVQQWAACETAVGLYTKKRVFNKVMLLRRLHEEEVILVRDMKQHWEYLRRSAGTLRDLASQQSDDLSRHKTAVGLYTKKRVFDKVMLLRRLHEEEVILVRDMKQHWEYLRRSAGTLRDLASQQSDDLSRHKTAVGLYTKKRVFDKVMLLRRLHEEEVILVRDMKQHWEYLRRSAGTLRDLASQQSDDLSRHRGSRVAHPVKALRVECRMCSTV